MFAAIAARDPEEVEALLAADPALAEARTAEGRSAVAVARARYELEIVALLLAAGPRLDVFDAAMIGDTPALRALIAEDPTRLTDTDTDGYTPLHLAAYFQQEDAVRVLLDLGASATAWSTGEALAQPLHLAATRPRNGAICRALVTAGADVNAPQEDGGTPLHRAAQSGDAETIEALLDLGARRDAESDDGFTPAELAYALERDEIAELIRGWSR